MFERFVVGTLAVGAIAGILLPTHPHLGHGSIAEQPVAAAHVITTDYGTSAVVLERSRSGHFFVDARVNGQSVRFIVDTGASAVALTKADAQRIGIAFSPADFTVIGRSASGELRGENVTLGSIAIGNKEVTGVSGVVLDDGLDVSLLGQSFLERIASVRITGDEMVLD